MLLVKCIVAIRKFIIVIYVFPRICFGVDGNAGYTSKKYLPIQNLSKKLAATEQSQRSLISLYSISATREDIGGRVSKQG